MDFIKLTYSGKWWIESESDSRWNQSGWSEELPPFTSNLRPKEITNELRRLGKKHGKRPGDLKWGYSKD